jgi:hypothetical protein
VYPLVSLWLAPAVVVAPLVVAALPHAIVENLLTEVIIGKLQI